MDPEAEKTQENTDVKNNEGEKKEVKTFTQEDLDRVAGERAKRAEEKAAKDLAAAIKKEREEWDRQAKLTAEEKEAELRKQRDTETEARQRELDLRGNRYDAMDVLKDKNIPTDLVDFVVDVDSDKTVENIDKLEKAFLKAVEEGVATKLKGNTPPEKKDNTGDTKKSTADLLFGRK